MMPFKNDEIQVNQSMHNCFLSVVLIADAETTPNSILRDVKGVLKQIHQQFSEKEILIIQNGASFSVMDALAPLPVEMHKLFSIIKLTNPAHENVACLAGLEHSRGQWTVLLTPLYINQPHLITKLYNHASQQRANIITLNPVANNFVIQSTHILNRGFGAILKRLNGLSTPPPLTADGIFSRHAISNLTNYRDRLTDLPMAYAQSGMAGTTLTAEQRTGSSWRDPVELFFTYWRRILRGSIIRYLTLLHSALVFAYAWLTTLNIEYIAPIPNGENPNTEIIKALHNQNIVQAWMWFALSLGMIGLYQIWRRLRQLPPEAPYTIQEVIQLPQ